jgi:1-deoxy-D-xylulose-5-phosphate synthase
VELAKQNEKIIGITPAMPTGSSMKYMMEAFPKRAFDVGIAEQHAVTLAAGMATQGMVVFCNIYSTFLQRSYDQVIHDVALQNLPVIFCLDRAGLVGEDGATHHGVFDIAYLNCIPNMIIAAPKDEIELRNIMYTAAEGLKQPIAIRYPRGRGEIVNWQQPFEKIEIGKSKLLKKGTKIAVLSTGTIGNNVTKALASVENEALFSHYHFAFIKPLEEGTIKDIIPSHEVLITIEDGVIKGGFGAQVNSIITSNNYKVSVLNLGIPDLFIEHGTVFEQQHFCKIDVQSLIHLFNTISHD